MFDDAPHRYYAMLVYGPYLRYPTVGYINELYFLNLALVRKSFQAVRHVRVALTLVLDVTFLYQFLLYVWRIFLKIGFLEV